MLNYDEAKLSDESKFKRKGALRLRQSYEAVTSLPHP